MSLRRLQRTIITLLFLLSPVLVVAQSPRKVLLEEFTNATSPAAASQDSIFQLHYVGESEMFNRVVPIVYHTSFPAPDSFNVMQPAMHNARSAFYGITDVPTVRVNGRVPSSGSPYAGAPADTPTRPRSPPRWRQRARHLR
jgi:hypothetical protein